MPILFSGDGADLSRPLRQYVPESIGAEYVLDVGQPLTRKRTSDSEQRRSPDSHEGARPNPLKEVPKDGWPSEDRKGPGEPYQFVVPPAAITATAPRLSDPELARHTICTIGATLDETAP